MLVKVSGCSWPSTLFLASVTSSPSASFYRPWLLYVIARLVMLVRYLDALGRAPSFSPP